MVKYLARVFGMVMVLILGMWWCLNSVLATTGINRKINFQGKVVNTDGTNVTDGNYDFVFKVYDALGAGTSLWTEAWNSGTTQVSVVNGIFTVDLGTYATFPPTVDFNTDNLYLTLSFDGDTEMTPRMQMAAVPYAMNAEKVGGLTVTNSTGTLTIPDGKIISFGDSFTTTGVGITLDQSLATTDDVTFAELSIGGSVTFSAIPLGTGSTVLYIGAGGVLVQGTLPAGGSYTATNGLNLNGSAFGMGGVLSVGTSLSLGTNFLSILGVNSNTQVAYFGTNGNVGIGTTNPTHKFQVNGEIFIPNMTGVLTVGNYGSISETGGGWAYIQGNNLKASPNTDNKFYKSGLQADPAQYIAMRYDRGIYFGTGIGAGDAVGTEYDDNVNTRMYISLTGNVGIGTTSTKNKLNIALVQADNLSASTATIADSFLHLGGGEYGAGRYYLTTYGYGIGQTNPSAYIGGLGTSSAGYGKTALVFGTRDVVTDTLPTERMRIDTNGNVGIGTTAPAYSLDTTGDLRIQGGTLYLTGIASSPSTTEGTVYYDTDDDQLKVYANGKWQSDRTTATKIVAASDSQNGEKADYVCDGTDDQVEINAAITALPAGGGVVYLLDGIYNIADTQDTQITIAKSNVSLIGSGKSTVLTRKSSHTEERGLIVLGNVGGTAYSGIYISQIAINGNKASYNSRDNNSGIYLFGGLTQIQIKNNWIYNNSTGGINNRNASTEIIIEGNDVRGNANIGIYSAGGEYLTISNNNVYSNGSPGSGISLNGSEHSLISGNNITNGNEGIYVAGAYNTITGNVIAHNSADGIRVTNVWNTVTGNIITTNGYNGIKLTSSSNVVSSNKIHDSGGSGSYSGIHLEGDANSNTISSNDITDTDGSGYAINISASTCDTNYLVGNRYSGTGATNINDAGTGTIYGAQLANSGADLLLTPSGNVGIGTTVPGYKLDVNGNVGIGGSVTFSAIPLGTGTTVLYIGAGGVLVQGTLPAGGQVYTAGNGLNLAGSIFGLGGTLSQLTKIDLNSNNFGLFGTGSMGVGTTSPAYKLDVTGDAMVSTNLTVGGSLSLTGTPAGIGTSVLYIAANGNITSGTLPPLVKSKSIVLSPEYAGASLSADGSGTTSVSVTSDNTLNDGGVGWKNYYQLSSTNAALQDYSVIVRVTLPSDFGTWETGSCPGTTCALEFAYQTGVGTTGDNAVSYIVSNDVDTPETAVCSVGNTASTAWGLSGCTEATLNDGAASEWDAAGETAVIRIKMAAKSTASALTRIGDIILRYRSTF